METLEQLSQRNPTWTLEDFVDVANGLLPQHLPKSEGNQRIREEINPRLVRHYTSQGLIDSPERQGKYAVYRYRHLLQVLVGRRLLSEGLGVSAIAQLVTSKTDLELENLLRGGIQIEVNPANTALAFIQNVKNRESIQPSASGPPPTSSPEKISSWYHLEILPGLEVHIRSDFNHPDTPSQQEFLKQQVFQAIKTFMTR